MRSFDILTLVAVLGAVTLTAVLSTLGSAVPGVAVAAYNLWLLATVAVVVAFLVMLCFRFFAFITGERRG